MIDMSTEEDSGTFLRSDSTRSLRFLLVEDSATDAHLVRLHLQHGLDELFSIRHVECVADAIKWLNRGRFDLILLDLTLPDSSGIQTFHSIFKHAENDAILILSGHEDGELAVEAVRGGAQDFILKGELSPRALGLEVRFAMERNNRIRAERELDNTRDQIRLARKLQQGLFPRAAPICDGFDIAGRAWAAEHACGDYFDFVPMGQGSMGIVVGDVSGHGLGPALKMVETRAALNAFAEYEDNLNKLICGIHRVFSSGKQFHARGLFLTLFLGRLHAANRTFHYSSAGHPAFHLDANGDSRELESTDYPIGLVENMSGSEEQSVTLSSGDVIVIPTDGFFEAGAKINDLFGIDRMLDVVRAHRNQTAEEIVNAMYMASRNHTPDLNQEDDMAAIVLKVV